MSNDPTPKIQVTKSLPVSKDKLYKAWTEEDQLKQWWKPMGKELKKVENDIKPGGTVTYHFDENLHVQGEYKEAQPGDRLVYSWNWELPEESMHHGSYLLTVQFSDDGEGSKLDVTQENFASEHAIKPHETGWEEALNALQQHLGGNNAA